MSRSVLVFDSNGAYESVSLTGRTYHNQLEIMSLQLCLLGTLVISLQRKLDRRRRISVKNRLQSCLVINGMISMGPNVRVRDPQRFDHRVVQQ